MRTNDLYKQPYKIAPFHLLCQLLVMSLISLLRR